MHPAFSVIFLTTLLGVGQGLLPVIVLRDLVRVNSFAEFSGDPGRSGRFGGSDVAARRPLRRF